MSPTSRTRFTFPGNPPAIVNIPGNLSLSDPTKVNTSWSGVLNGVMRKDGRVGYSVKFVSFRLTSEPPHLKTGRLRRAGTMTCKPMTKPTTTFAFIRH